MEAFVLFGVFLLLMLAGIPIGVALGVSGLLVLLVFDLGFQMGGVNFVSGIASFPLLAIPFFVLAGVIMEKAGLATSIARLFELIVGRRKGGMAMVAVLTCMFWGALSGSGPATTAAVGLILLAPMIRQGYDKPFAAAVMANAADLSIIIPPSIAFILYGSITGTSVGALFLGGIIPGLLMGLGLLLATAWVSRRRGYRSETGQGSLRDILTALRSSFWALLSPIIILGGIYTGFFTPTEAAVVAVFYSLFIAAVVHRTLTLRLLLDMLVEATITTATIMFVVACAGIFSWAASTTGLIDAVANGIVRISPNVWTMLLLIDLLLLALGMFLDAISISYLIIPILIPVMTHFGVDPIWFGVIFVSALAIGQATPPVGVNLFTAANLADCDIDGVARESLPLIVAAAAVLVIISLWPALSLWLPVVSGNYAP